MLRRIIDEAHQLVNTMIDHEDQLKVKKASPNPYQKKASREDQDSSVNMLKYVQGGV